MPAGCPQTRRQCRRLPHRHAAACGRHGNSADTPHQISPAASRGRASLWRTRARPGFNATRNTAPGTRPALELWLVETAQRLGVGEIRRVTSRVHHPFLPAPACRTAETSPPAPIMSSTSEQLCGARQIPLSPSAHPPRGRSRRPFISAGLKHQCLPAGRRSPAALSLPKITLSRQRRRPPAAVPGPARCGGHNAGRLTHLYDRRT